MRRRSSDTDPRWAVARATPVFSARMTTIESLLWEVEIVPEPGVDGVDGVDGVLASRPHATGWFVWAVRRDDLEPELEALFRELVTVRTYLLLCEGTTSHLWRPVPSGDEWRSALPRTMQREQVFGSDMRHQGGEGPLFGDPGI